MPSAYEIAATGLATIINTEFDPEDLLAQHDKLHESLGRRRPEIGISPVRQQPQARNKLVLETTILVQFYDLWVQEISPDTQVNPFKIAGYAERFWKAAESQQATGNNQVWYYSVESIDFPDDPTGNKTRFHATVLARGDNVGLVNRL